MSGKLDIMRSIRLRKVIRITIKRKIESACAMAGITVTELGRKMGMSQQSMSNRLKTGKFTQEELERMADVMGCEYHSVFIFPNGNKVE
jgi:lambda repressor-like predicted transcriptional regulator